MKTRTLITALLIVIIGLGIGYAQEKDAVMLQEAWYDCYLQNQKIGYFHATIEKVEYEKKECYKFSEEMVMKMQQDENNIIEMKSQIASFVDINYSPLYIVKNDIDAGQTKSSYITVSEDEITFKKTLNNEKPEITKIKKENNLSYGVDGFILKNMGLLKVGAEASFKTISTEINSIQTQTVKILREEKIKVNKEEINTYYTESTNSEMPGETIQINIDKDGCTVLVKMSGIELRRTSKTQAKDMKKPIIISSYIDTNANISSRDMLSQLKLTMTFKEKFDVIIPSNEYQEVTQDKEKYSITLKAISYAVKIPIKLPAGDESVKKYLNPSVLVQSKDAAIIAQAKEIIRDEKDALKTTQLLCEWVFKNLKKERGPIAQKSATEALRDKSGDCTEHAVLLCALGRAAGIPVRQIYGLVFDGSHFGYHAWTEVHLGKWIPVDATINRVGIPAGYIKLGETEEGDKESNTTLLKIVKIIGNVSIEITSAKDNDNKSIDLSGKK